MYTGIITAGGVDFVHKKNNRGYKKNVFPFL